MPNDIEMMTDAVPSSSSAKLAALQPGCFCFHKSWGTGKIVSIDSLENQLTIDFVNRPGHYMALDYALQSLKFIPPEYIEARLIESPNEVREQAQKDPIALMLNIVQSLGRDATATRIEQLLCPAIIPASDWKKWWDAAKKALRKDTRFTLPTKRTDSITFNDSPADPFKEAVDEFKAAIGPKAQIAALAKVEKFWNKKEGSAETQEIINSINNTLRSTPKTQTILAVELILARDDFMVTAGAQETSSDLALASYLPKDVNALFKLLNNLPSQRQVQCLQRVRKDLANWSDLFLGILPNTGGRMMDVILETFKQENRLVDLQTALERLIRERRLTPDLMVWICKNRDGEMNSLITPQIFSAILSVLEYDQLADYKKGTKLHDLLINEKTLVRDILASASHDEVRDITRAVILSPVFEELNKRSLLATLVKLYPFVQSMIAGGDHKTNNQALIVSWESLERRKAELDEIITKKIPENTKEIAVARSYGDLRENHEFKAAKEMQAVLMRRKAELEAMVTSAQGTDFKNVNASEVNIGTHVTVVDTEGSSSSTYTILGAWDSKPEEGIISYLTPVAKALIGKKVGESAELLLDTGAKRSVRIESITPYKS
jgi:transcription elongation factor GreA-like protein/transcription elongation GreA/GreB family factor